jgi:hypothetical protein
VRVFLKLQILTSNGHERGPYIDNSQNLALHSTISYSLSLSHSYHSLGLQTHLKWHLQQIEPDFYRALSGSYFPPVDSSESFSEIANIDIKRARKRAISGQQVQADSLTKNTKTKLTVLSPPLDDILLTISLTLLSLTGTSDTSKVAFATN